MNRLWFAAVLTNAKKIKKSLNFFAQKKEITIDLFFPRFEATTQKWKTQQKKNKRFVTLRRKKRRATKKHIHGFDAIRF